MYSYILNRIVRFATIGDMDVAYLMAGNEDSVNVLF